MLFLKQQGTGQKLTVLKASKASKAPRAPRKPTRVELTDPRALWLCLAHAEGQLGILATKTTMLKPTPQSMLHAVTRFHPEEGEYVALNEAEMVKPCAKKPRGNWRKLDSVKSSLAIKRPTALLPAWDHKNQLDIPWLLLKKIVSCI